MVASAQCGVGARRPGRPLPHPLQLSFSGKVSRPPGGRVCTPGGWIWRPHPFVLHAGGSGPAVFSLPSSSFSGVQARPAGQIRAPWGRIWRLHLPFASRCRLLQPWATRLLVGARRCRRVPPVVVGESVRLRGVCGRLALSVCASRRRGVWRRPVALSVASILPYGRHCAHCLC